MSNIRLIDANALIRRVNENEFYTDKLKLVLCSIVDTAPTVEAVPLSWWNELKDIIKSWKDDPLEKITTSIIVELVLYQMNRIEEKGTEKQCF